MLLEYLLATYMRGYTARLLPAVDTPGSPFPEAWENTPTMLYLHIPFCRELCPFCTFYRIPFDEDLARRYFAALRTQLKRFYELGYRFSTVYFGGGTPTVLPDELASLIGEIRNLWEIKELSVETNPSDLTPENIAMLKSSGVNRLSVGVQSFQDNLLESVNRIRKYGTSADIRKRLTEIRGIFDTLNVDLIFGLAGQTQGDVAADLGIIKFLEIDQVTCYPLMKSGRELGGPVGWMKGAGREKETYHMIRKILTPEYVPASAWCFSRRKGMIDEYIVEHSSYSGAGSGAFGLEKDTMMINVFSVPAYISAAEAGIDTTVFRHRFKRAESFRYRLLMQLFRGFVDIGELTQNETLLRKISIRGMILLLFISGTARLKSGKIVVTKRGAYLSVLLMKLFFEGVGDLRGSCVNAHAENPSQFNP
jgi:menaquinone C8-methyltransferase